MRLILDGMEVQRGSLVVRGSAIFSEGTHIVSGPVGSGKSTLALTMAGLLVPSSGAVLREEISSCMLSLQFPEYHLTGSTLAEECRSYGVDPASILSTEGFEKEPDRDPLSLSHGELKRIHLACILERSYDILLLDEPYSALDCGQKERLCTRLSECDTGIIIIFTHEQEFLPHSDQFWEIREGCLLAKINAGD